MAGGPQTLGIPPFGASRFGDESVVTTFAHTAVMGLTYTIGSTAPSLSQSGTSVYGLARFGDGLAVSIKPKKNAMGISYSITPSKHAQPMGVTYTVQKPNTAPMLIYYLVTPPSTIAINGDGSIKKPDRVTYTPRPVAGRTLIGGPLLQGYPLVTWSYTVLSWSDLQSFMKYYNPTNPIVTVIYPDETGTWIQRLGVMHPPTFGDMQTMLVTNVSISFSILPG